MLNRVLYLFLPTCYGITSVFPRLSELLAQRDNDEIAQTWQFLIIQDWPANLGNLAVSLVDSLWWAESLGFILLLPETTAVILETVFDASGLVKYDNERYIFLCHYYNLCIE